MDLSEQVKEVIKKMLEDEFYSPAPIDIDWVNEIIQLERIKRTATIFIEEAESILWKGIRPQLGQGESSLDSAYNHLKKLLNLKGLR